MATGSNYSPHISTPSPIATSASTLKMAKTDQGVTSSTSLVNATGLSIAIEPHKSYIFEAWLPFGVNGATPGFAAGIGGPSGAVFVVYTGWAAPSAGGGILSGGAAATAFSQILSVANSTTGSTFGFYIRGAVSNGANAGNLTPQIAQKVSDSAASILKAGAWFRVTEVS